MLARETVYKFAQDDLTRMRIARKWTCAQFTVFKSVWHWKLFREERSLATKTMSFVVCKGPCCRETYAHVVDKFTCRESKLQFSDPILRSLANFCIEFGQFHYSLSTPVYGTSGLPSNARFWKHFTKLPSWRTDPKIILCVDHDLARILDQERYFHSCRVKRSNFSKYLFLSSKLEFLNNFPDDKIIFSSRLTKTTE